MDKDVYISLLRYFPQRLVAAYADAPMVAVNCDNGSTHHSRHTKRWLANTAPATMPIEDQHNYLLNFRLAGKNRTRAISLEASPR